MSIYMEKAVNLIYIDLEETFGLTFTQELQCIIYFQGKQKGLGK